LRLLEQVAARLKALLSDSTDQALVRARASGEVLVAAMRLGFIALFSALVLFYAKPQTQLLELGLAAGALGYGAIMFAVASKIRKPWISWLTSAIDISLITASLLLYALSGDPWGAVNNRTYFDLYFFIMANAALRYDWRLCAFTTILVLAQFLGLTAYVRAHWTGQARLDPFLHAVRILTLAAAGVTSVAVARWARHLRLMVGTDHLTGLSQRRPFLERIEEELQRSQGDRERASLSIALLDFDEFKKFNDSHGHMAGDLALQLLAARLRKSVRSSDLVARFGGEEFVIAFPRMDVERAVKRVNELREELAAVPIPVAGSSHHLTVSAGVGSWPADGDSFEKVLAAVDERLYAAKTAGRNRVVGPRSHLRAVDV
jgi:diguanylate cyclase (GGDEF)-like protein